MAAVTEEQIRLDESNTRTKHWKKWGPYLSERAWGTVREDYSLHGNAWEYFPHDHARSRATQVPAANVFANYYNHWKSNCAKELLARLLKFMMETRRTAQEGALLKLGVLQRFCESSFKTFTRLKKKVRRLADY